MKRIVANIVAPMVVLCIFGVEVAFGGIEGIATGKRFLADGKIAVGVNYWGSKAATQITILRNR